MKTLIIRSVFAMALFSVVFTQTSANPIEPTPTTTSVSLDAQFPGGYDALAQFIAKNLQYPMEARENGVEGKVVVNFLINAAGEVQNVNIQKGIGSGCDEEAKRVVALMPDWEPALRNGKAVSTVISMPIRFTFE